MLIIVFAIGLFLGIQQIMGGFHPLPRLALFPLIGLLYYYKDIFDSKLSESLSQKNIIKGLKILFIVLIVLRGGLFVRKILKPVKHPEDITGLYLKSVDHLFKKFENPYKFDINPDSFIVRGKLKHYNKMKYPPGQILTYGPFIYFGGIEGMMILHLFLYALTIFIIFKLLRSLGIGYSYLAGILILATEWYFNKYFNKVLNDFLPTLLLVFSLIFAQKNKDVKAGWLLGLSCAMKQVPGGLFAFFFLLQRRWKIAFWSIVPFLIISVPFFFSGFTEFYENVIEWSMLRKGGRSIIYYFPEPFPKIIYIASVIALFGVCIWGYKKEKINLQNNWNLFALGPIWFLLFSKITFANHFTWVFPFFVVWYLMPKDKTLKI